MLRRLGLALLSLLALTASTPTPGIEDLVDAGVIPPAADPAARAGVSLADPPQSLVLPDLHTLPPTDLQLQLFPGSGIRRLRFANTIWNSGPGDLDLHASPFPLPGAVKVFQHIPTAGGSSVTHEAGLFDFHPEHGHWHWEGFGLYEVLTVSETGQLGDVVAVSDKVGYCLIDVDPMLSDASAGTAFYTSCIWTRQGISAGWTDTYEAHIGGQFVDISDLPDGLYALRSTVDPDDIILEADDANNSSMVFFQLYGEVIVVMGDTFFESGPVRVED